MISRRLMAQDAKGFESPSVPHPCRPAIASQTHMGSHPFRPTWVLEVSRITGVERVIMATSGGSVRGWEIESPFDSIARREYARVQFVNLKPGCQF